MQFDATGSHHTRAPQMRFLNAELSLLKQQFLGLQLALPLGETDV
jgi:hypothetical protein